MKIQIKGTDIELTPSIKKYIMDKIGGLDKFLDKFQKESQVVAEVEIARTTRHHKSGEIYYAEVNLDLKGDKLRAENKDEDVRSAIDGLKDILKREILTLKEKKTDKKRNAGRPGKPRG